MIYDLLRKPPPFGSLLELVCMVVQRERQQLSILGVRAQAQAAIGGDKAEEAFKDFVNAQQRVEREDNSAKMREKLEALKDIKEIRFTPIAMAERKIKLPTVDAQTLREAGVLSEQARVLGRPQRAREQRRRR